MDERVTLERALIELRPTSDSFAVNMGFESERERFEMILNVPSYLEDAVLRWMDEDHTKAGLEKILNTKRPVRRKGDQ
jgi:hypothetical protein